jgi:hypothetical protein
VVWSSAQTAKSANREHGEHPSVYDDYGKFPLYFLSNRVLTGRMLFMRIFRPAGLILVMTHALPSFGEAVTLEQLHADQAALDAASRDFQQRADSLPPAEREDYRSYIDRLRQRLATDCSLLQAASVALPTDISCPGLVHRIAPAAIDQHNEKTRNEATATLDAELDAGLGEFDQRLLREQERVKAKAAKSTGGGAAAGGQGAGTAGEGSGESAAIAGSTSAKDTASAASTAEQPPSAAGGPKGDQSARAPQPADVPDGRDDDVVARQLREAAEKESDPELRKKLWDEYRRYKQGVR